MFRAIVLQVVVTVAAAVVAGLLVGMRGVISAAAGGGVCILPNLLFALRLKSVSLRAGRFFAANFLVGELAKVVLTIVLLVAIAKMYTDLHWPSLLIGLVLATQAMFLAFWKKTDHVNGS